MYFIGILTPFISEGTFFYLFLKRITGHYTYGQLSHYAGTVPDFDALFQGLLRRFGEGLAGLNAPPHTKRLIDLRC